MCLMPYQNIFFTMKPFKFIYVCQVNRYMHKSSMIEEIHAICDDRQNKISKSTK